MAEQFLERGVVPLLSARHAQQLGSTEQLGSAEQLGSTEQLGFGCRGKLLEGDVGVDQPVRRQILGDQRKARHIRAEEGLHHLPERGEHLRTRTRHQDEFVHEPAKGLHECGLLLVNENSSVMRAWRSGWLIALTPFHGDSAPEGPEPR